MAVASRKEFIACVTKSNAIPEDKLTAWLEVVDEEDPKKIATKLVRDKLLTAWQAKFLLSGKSRLSVGNYMLRSRISRDDLGDKFEAIHSQLNRKVVIQVFPSSIAKNEKLLKKLLKKLRQITELDHPNLVHIYDVDQESNRYFLVTEFVEGETLNLVSPQDLTDPEVAVIVQGLAAGIAYAHQNEILHGNVTDENIIITPAGKAELQGFPSATLTGAMDAEAKAPSASNDFRRLAKIGSRLLKEMPKKSRTEQFGDIAAMVVGLKDDDKRDQCLASLKEWVSENSKDEAVALDDDLETEEDSFVSMDPVAEAGGFDSPMAVVPKTVLKKKAETPEPESDDRGFVTKMWEDKKPAFIACSAAILLTVCGGAGAIGYMLTSGSAPNAVGDANTRVALSDKPNAALADTNAAEGALSVDRETKASLNPEANRKKLADFFAKRDGKQTAPEEVEMEENKEPENKETVAAVVDAPPAETETSSKPMEVAKKEEPAVVAKSTETKSKPEVPPGDTEKSVAAAAPTKPTPTKPKPKPKTKTSKEIGNPFEKFRKLVDLREATDTSDLKISNLVIAKNHLLGLELLAGPQIGRGKIEFKLNRSQTDKQLWDVELGIKRSDPVAVAQFQKTPTEMKFRWLPAAADNKDANFLRNCMLKLATPKDSAWLGLRTPTAIENFNFVDDKGATKAEAEIGWLPNANGIKAELQPMPFKGDKTIALVYLPREITKREPGRIFFHKSERSRHFFVEVSADLRKKARFNAQMMLALPQRKPQPVRSIADLEGLARQIDVQKVEAMNIYQQSLKAKKPEEMNQGEFDGLKKKVKDSSDNLGKLAETSIQNINIAKQLSGKIVQLEVYFEMEGHRIVIAKSK